MLDVGLYIVCFRRLKRIKLNKITKLKISTKFQLSYKIGLYNHQFSKICVIISLIN